MKEVILSQSSDEWLLWRNKGIGASEANILAGKNRWSTVVDLWELKTEKSESKFEMNAAVQHGIDTEPEARTRFIEATGINMTPKCFEHKEHDFIRASLDGISDDSKLVLEIKCPSALGIHMKTVKGVIPEYYYPQLQHQLFVTGAELGLFWSYVQTMGGFLIEVEPNRPYTDELIAREIKFWEAVQSDIPPKIGDFLELQP